MSVVPVVHSRRRIGLPGLRPGGLAALALALLAPQAALAREVPFGAQQTISTIAAGVRSVFAADVDGDGDLDALSASQFDGKIAWYENLDGAGTFGPQHVVSIAGNAFSVFAADVDGDGDTDVLSASQFPDEIAWYENDGGAPPVWTERVVSTSASGAWSVFAADVDRDGDLDLLSASLYDNKIAWYQNDGASPPGWTERVITTTAVNAISVFAADLDGDGDTDVLSAAWAIGRIAWYENLDGAGTFSPELIITSSAVRPRQVFAADVDGDGDSDVLSASQEDDTIAWYENDGTPGGAGDWTEHLISATADGSASVFAADVDGDGDTDIVSASQFDNKIAWYENNGASPPGWTDRTISTAATFAFSVVAPDLDGDGDLDVLSGSVGDDRIAWYENLTIHRSAVFPEQRTISTAADYAREVVPADVDGDGDVDALSASENDDKIAWYENLDGQGNFGPQQAITTAADGARSVFAADVDGDGDLDALSASIEDDTIAWYENDGTPGGLGDWIEHVISTVADGAVEAFAADVDGDGDLDVLSASNFNGEVVWYENLSGAGVFGPKQVIDIAAGVWSASAADIDGDGDMDVLSALTSADTIAWYENLDGAGTFGPRQVLTNTADFVLSVFAADVDGDGDLDVLAASYFDLTVAWYENDGSPGGLGDWTRHVIGLAALGALNVTGADVDGDGDLDALATLYPDHEVVWYENLDGVGTFGPKRLIVAELYLFSVASADVDGDGDLDALTASGIDTIGWCPNKGGQFALATTNVTPPAPAPGAINAVLKVVVMHRGRPGDTDLELTTLELRFEQVDAFNPGARPRRLTSDEANALVEDLFVYLDNGDGVFAPGDFAVATVGTLTLVGGVQTVTFADGDANFRVAMGAPRTYFVALHTAAGASSQFPNDFRIVHLTDSSSSAEDAAADVRLALEFAPPVSSGLVGFPPRVVSVVPQDNALNVPAGTNVTVIFSEPVHPATVTPSTILMINPDGVPVPASVGLAPDGLTATLDPAPAAGSLAFSSVYTIEVTSGVLDLAGVAAVPFNSRCATAPGPVTGTPLPSVSDQAVLPGQPPGPLPGGLSSSAALSGSTVGPNLGFSVTAAGDLNNDTLADFVGGAPGYAPGGLMEAGAAAIYLGSNAQEPSSGNHPREVPDVIFTGQAAHDRAGTSVAAGFDFDGDGIGDILIGAEQVDRTVDPPEVSGTGKVYLIYFKPQEYDFNANGTPDYLEGPEMFVSLAQVGAGISGVVFTGAAAGDQAGYAVAAGGRLESSDARDEIVIGAPGAGNDDGKVYVVFSGSGASGVKSLGDVGGAIPGVVYLGSAGERLGSSVALPGDLTDPEGPDIAMGAPLADTTAIGAGRVYVATAGNLGAGTVNASAIATQVHGDQTCEQLGFAVAGGGDNRAAGSPALAGGDMDLLIGAPCHDAIATPVSPCPDPPIPNSGRVVQTTGRLPGAAIGAGQVGSTVEGVIWRGVQAGGGLGWSVARLGDLSGNNLDDIGLGAPFVSPGMSGAGAVYVVEGSANTGLLGVIDADQVGQIVSGGIFLGTQLGEEAGLAICAAGDLDGDGSSGSATADDFTVGSPGWDTAAGTVHQVLGTLLQQPGECTALGCTVADLRTGAVLVVPPNALAQGTKFRFQVEGLASLPSSCGSHALPGRSLVGWSDYTRTDCGAPPCAAPGFALGPTIEVPTRQELEYQLAQGEPLALRYCDATFGWTAVPAGPATGLVQDNSFVAGRKAVAASSVDTLRRYGVFFDDLDQDDARDSCDCSPGDATRWSVPGPAGTLLFTAQAPTSATLSWGPPACIGGSPGAVLYDTIRSTNPSDFVTGAVCVEANGADTTSLDANNPPSGQVFYYIVSPENGCLSGSACLDPACVQRAARDC